LLFPSKHKLEIDFQERNSPYSRKLSGQSELIAKAVRMSLESGRSKMDLLVFDFCFGLGVDSWTLARLGCQVHAFEREALLCDLFEKSLAFAQTQGFSSEAFSRLHLHRGDANALSLKIAERHKPDVIFLDPMFAPPKKTALPKIEMQLLREWLGPADEEAQLFASALSLNAKKIVVKRARLAPPLQANPSHQVQGKSFRFDVYVR
jgi:16S rRNA (guanine1516-N2)-methyltransferase